MATQNSSNQDYTNNADGFSLAGGSAKRKITVTSGDVTLSGSSTPKTYTFPNQDGTVALLETVYPVGSIYMSVNSANPSTLFGGTWVAWGTGRVPVAVDTGQAEFNTVEKTGGHKAMQAHSHTAGYIDYNAGRPSYMPDSTWTTVLNNPGGVAYNSLQTASYGAGDSQNLQPYITCYMWKRTA